MTQQAAQQAGAQTPPGRNLVSLCGRVSSAPVERSLPSGDGIVTLRVVLAREKSPMSAKSRQASDWVDCVAWGGRAKRVVSRWRLDDIVEIDGALRRRFFRAEGRTSTRVEVEVLGGRRVQRAG